MLRIRGASGLKHGRVTSSVTENGPTPTPLGTLPSYAGEENRCCRRHSDRRRWLRGAKPDSGHGDVHIATDDLHK
jgi:hypothetical protein